MYQEIGDDFFWIVCDDFNTLAFLKILKKIKSKIKF